MECPNLAKSKDQIDKELSPIGREMTLKVLTIGDPHIQMRHLNRVRTMIAEIIRVAKEIHPDLIVVLGDVLHTHSKLHLSLQCMAFDWIENLSQIAPVRLLVGNHDRINNSDFMTNVHPFRGLEKNAQIWVVWKTMTETLQDKTLVYVPYVSPGRFLEALDGVDLRAVDGIFAHQEVYGCKLGPGVVSEHGDHWSLEYPVVFSGHIHGRQTVQPNWIYIGAPMQHAQGDSADRGLSLIDFDQSGYHEDRVYLQVPKLITLDVTPEDLIDLEIPENAEVRVRVTGTSAQLKAVPDQIWKSLKSKGVQIDKKTIGVQRIHDLDPGKTFFDLLMNTCSESMKAELKTLLPDPWELRH